MKTNQWPISKWGTLFLTIGAASAMGIFLIQWYSPIFWGVFIISFFMHLFIMHEEKRAIKEKIITMIIITGAQVGYYFIFVGLSLLGRWLIHLVI